MTTSNSLHTDWSPASGRWIRVETEIEIARPPARVCDCVSADSTLMRWILEPQSARGLGNLKRVLER
ncbi:MAG: hypothetical protein HYU75_08905 [Betaproteobacteria bacterium]|nr:hypothetical protein [Betaproteobacteria bacterium]